MTTPGQWAKQWAKLWAWLQRLGPSPGHSLVPSRQKRAVLATEKCVEQIGKEQNQAAQDAVSLGKSSLAVMGMEPQLSSCLEVGVWEVGARSRTELMEWKMLSGPPKGGRRGDRRVPYFWGNLSLVSFSDVGCLRLA